MIVALVFSLLVAFFWLKKFRKMDKYEKEPERLIFLSFIAGVLATGPSILLEIPFQMTASQKPPLLTGLMVSLLWVGKTPQPGPNRAHRD